MYVDWEPHGLKTAQQQLPVERLHYSLTNSLERYKPSLYTPIGFGGGLFYREVLII